MQDYIKNYKDSTVQWRSTKNIRMTTQAISLAENKQIKWVFVYFLHHTERTSLPSHKLTCTSGNEMCFFFSTWKISKEANDNMFDKPGSSCLSITVLPAKNAGQVKDRLAALSACSHFWIATDWNQFSHKVKAVINDPSCGNARYAPRSCEKEHFIISPYQSSE